MTALTIDVMRDLIEEAAKDILRPIVDTGQFVGSLFDVSNVAEDIAERFGQLIDEGAPDVLDGEAPF